jgi:sugar lactone lactonase YvrE
MKAPKPRTTKNRKACATRSLRLATATLFVASLMLCQQKASAQIVTTLAGSGVFGSADGNGAMASFGFPRGVSVGPSGDVYVADTGNLKIRRITPDGLVTTIAGDGHPGYDAGKGTEARFFGPLGVAADASGNVWVADQDDGFDGQYVKKITPDGVVHNLILYDGGNPQALAVEKSGNLYVLDYFLGLWKVTVDGKSNSLASLPHASGVAVDAAGNAYVADTDNNQVRKITPAGTMTTLAGSGSPGSTDGGGTAASFRHPSGLAVDLAGNVYVADSGNRTIRKITPSGFVTTLAGSGTPGSADGTGTAASFNSPADVALDGAGNLYVADSGNNKIRKIALPVDLSSPAVPDVSVRPDDTTGILRIHEGSGQMSLDTIDNAGWVTPGYIFGPYTGWTPRATAAASDGFTRVLWNNDDGSSALWLMGPQANEAPIFSAQPGLRAADVAASIGGVTHILWTDADGRVVISSVDNTGQSSAGPTYGPYPGWTAAAIADGPDGLTRVLWSHQDGRTAISFVVTGNLLSTYRYSPISGWRASDIAVGGDDLNRILWTNVDGRLTLWTVDSTGEITGYGPIYSAPAGLTASRVGAGPDGSTRILFTDGRGGAVLWLMTPDGVFQSSYGVGQTPALPASSTWDVTIEVTAVAGPDFCVYTPSVGMVFGTTYELRANSASVSFLHPDDPFDWEEYTAARNGLSFTASHPPVGSGTGGCTHYIQASSFEGRFSADGRQFTATETWSFTLDSGETRTVTFHWSGSRQ